MSAVMRRPRLERHPDWERALHWTRRAVQMKLAGASVAKIAAEFGVTDARAAKILRRGMERLARRNEAELEQLRALELERIDAMLHSISWLVDLGDPNSIDRALALSRERRKLLGLDAPVKIANTDADGNTAKQVPALAITFVTPHGEQQAVAVQPAQSALQIGAPVFIDPIAS